MIFLKKYERFFRLSLSHIRAILMSKILVILRWIKPQSIFDAYSSSNDETTTDDKTSVTDELKSKKRMCL